MNSKAKGKRGEREFAKICREQGFNARRSQQYAGGIDSADVIGLPGIHIEVKLRERITENDKMEFIKQAMRDAAGSSNLPIVAHREDYQNWYVTMEMQDFVMMYAKAVGSECIDCISNDILTVTMTLDAWFTVYREYYSALKLEGDL